MSSVVGNFCHNNMKSFLYIDYGVTYAFRITQIVLGILLATESLPHSVTNELCFKIIKNLFLAQIVLEGTWFVLAIGACFKGISTFQSVGVAIVLGLLSIIYPSVMYGVIENPINSDYLTAMLVLNGFCLLGVVQSLFSEEKMANLKLTALLLGMNAE